MQIFDVLARAQDGRLFDNIAQVYGLDPSEVEAVANNVLPFFAKAIERNTLSRGGLADIVGALGDGHHQLYLEDPRFIGSQVMVADGNNILGHILGSVDRSRAVADKVAAASGVGSDWVKQLLPILAALLMSVLSKQSSGGLGDILKRLPGGAGGGGGSPFPQGGDLGDILRRLPGFPGGGGQGQGGGAQGGDDGGWSSGGGDRRSADPGDIFRRIPGLPGSRDGDAQGGGGSIPGFPDQPAQRPAQQSPRPAANDDRESDNPFNLPGGLGDILKKIGGQQDDPASRPTQPAPAGRTAQRAPEPFPDQGPLGGGSPLPIPGNRIPGVNDGSAPRDNPYGDLSDIIRKGKLPEGANLPSGSPGGIVRDILGGLLGFQGRGLMGWIIQLIIYRWGWGILKRILGGMFRGR